MKTETKITKQLRILWRSFWLKLWLCGLFLLPCIWRWADPHVQTAQEALQASPPLTFLLALAAPFGKTGMQLKILGLCFVWAWLRWGRQKATAWIIVTLLCLMSTGLVVTITKVSVRRVRPAYVQRLQAQPSQWHDIRSGRRLSFPSGDAASVFAIATAAYAFSPPAAWPIFALGVLVSASRVAVGAHYFSDVWGALLLSTAVCAGVLNQCRRRGLLSEKILRKSKPQESWSSLVGNQEQLCPNETYKEKGKKPFVSMSALSLQTKSAEATREVGRCLASSLAEGDVLALCGTLGSGKTVFVQGIAQGLNVQGRVASPTFIIMRCHPRQSGLPPMLFHVDAYRLRDGEELWEMGLEDWLKEGVVAIEWAERVSEVLPADHLSIKFEIAGEERRLNFSASGPRSQRLVEHLHKCVC